MKIKSELNVVEYPDLKKAVAIELSEQDGDLSELLEQHGEEEDTENNSESL